MGRGQGNQDREPRGRGNDGDGGPPPGRPSVPDVFELSHGHAAPPGFIDRGRAANREPAEPPVLEEKPPEEDPELPYVEQPGGETEPAPLPYPEPEPPAAEVETAPPAYPEPEPPQPGIETAPPPYPAPSPPPEPVAEVEPAPPAYPQPAPPPDGDTITFPRDGRPEAGEDAEVVVVSFDEAEGGEGTITLTDPGTVAPAQDSGVITFTASGESTPGDESLFTISDGADDPEVVTITIDDAD